MNLIEQLGGYEKAKEIAFDPLHPQMTHVSNDGRHWVNEEFSHIPEIQEQIPTMIRIKDIRKAILEYRRQHNIFEPDDICKLKIKHNYGLCKFRRTKGDRIYLEDRLGFAEFGIHKDVVDHATDAEIKAGKRLEVKSEN